MFETTDDNHERMCDFVAIYSYDVVIRSFVWTLIMDRQKFSLLIRKQCYLDFTSHAGNICADKINFRNCLVPHVRGNTQLFHG